MRCLHFLAFLSLFPSSFLMAQTYAKDSFTIRGTLIGKDSGVVVLWYRDNNYFQRQKKLSLEKGSFTWSGSVKSACEAFLWTDTANKDFDDSTVVRFLLQPGTTSIAYNTSNSTYSISGSAAEDENKKWKEIKKSLLDTKASLEWSMTQLYKEQRVNKIDLADTIKVLANSHDSIRTLIQGLDLDYIKSNPNSFLSAYLLDKQKGVFIWIPPLLFIHC